MPKTRQIEANILGYLLERVVEDASMAPRFVVRAPNDDLVLASFHERIAAEQFIVRRELAGIRPRPSHPAY